MVILGCNEISLEQVCSIVYNKEKVNISKETLSKVKNGFDFLLNFSENKTIYGINTGFGPMAQYKINSDKQKELQYNLIRSHCSGSGDLLKPAEVRATILVRLNNFLQGKSGVHPETVLLLQDLLNHDITPSIYSHGGVGASGDLVQLAHLALNMIGEGDVFYKGNKRPTEDVFRELGIKALKIHIREGLAIINGTSVMTGIGLLNLIKAKQQVDWALLGSVTINEMVEAYDDHFSEELNNVKRHIGQRKVASKMRELAKESKLIRSRSQHLYNKKIEEEVFKDKVQEYYSIRCVPQILGPVLDTLSYSEEVLLAELHSVCDNPIVDPVEKNVYHGGNFHGDYISLEMDKIKTVMTKMSILIERQLNFLLNNKINNILPPFINHGTLGLNFGIQGAQFTAVSTVAENQTLSFPNYIHSIPNNNDNQDIVSMGTNSAVICRKVIENNFEVLSIYYLAIIQAVDYLGFQDKLAKATAGIHQYFRKHIPVFKEDVVINQYTHLLEKLIRQGKPQNLLNNLI